MMKLKEGCAWGVGGEHGLELVVHLDGDHPARLLHERERERADARPHLEHALGARELRQAP